MTEIKTFKNVLSEEFTDSKTTHLLQSSMIYLCNFFYSVADFFT